MESYFGCSQFGHFLEIVEQKQLTAPWTGSDQRRGAPLILLVSPAG